MKAHLAAGFAFVATESAAASFADDLDRVRALGARVVGEGAADEVLRRLPHGAAAEVASGDLDAAALTQALRLLGVEPAFAAVAVAVQDHGYAPGSSNRVLRFSLWEQAVAERRPIGDLFYGTDAVPPALTRLRAAADAAAALAGDAPALVADTGPAALYGALAGRSRRRRTRQRRERPHRVPSRARRAVWPASSSTTPPASTAPASRCACAAGWPATWRATEVRADHGHGALLARRRPRRRSAGAAAHRHRPAPRAARRQQAAGRVRGAARRHDAHRVLRPAARAVRPASRARRRRGVTGGRYGEAAA